MFYSNDLDGIFHSNYLDGRSDDLDGMFYSNYLDGRMFYSNDVDGMFYSNDADGMFYSNDLDGSVFSNDVDGRSRQKRSCSQSTVTTPKQCPEAKCRNFLFYSSICTLASPLTCSM